MKLIFRRVTPSDSPAIQALITWAETIDEGPAGGEMDPSQPGWLAQAGTGEVVGYSFVEEVVEEKAVNFWLRGLVLPDWRGRGIARELLRRSWVDIQRRRAAYRDQPAYVNAWCYGHDETRGRLFARLGLPPYHVYYELALPAEGIRPIPPLPPGLLIRPWSDDQCEAAVALRNRAFAGSWGYQPTTARALRRCFFTGRYEPQFSFTAWRRVDPAGERMVGVVHGSLVWTGKLRQVKEGEIVWVAVAPEARGQKIGEILMLTVMNALRQAGAEIVSVSADHPAGPPAIGLYLRLGFTLRKTIIDYRGEI